MRLCLLIFLTLVPALAMAESREARERREVVTIFDLLTLNMDVTAGDGLGSDVECVFPQEWDVSWRRNSKGEETEQFRPRELLSIREALDPKGQHAERFCDRIERDKRAKIWAQASGKNIAVANLSFSYPVFGRDFDSATLYFERGSILLTPGPKRNAPDLSSGIITLRKRKGGWTYKVTVTGMT
jgi:hypothetical protein